MKKIKKGLSLILVLTMALGLLSACGADPGNPNNSKNTPTPDAEGYAYVPAFQDLPADFGYIGRSCYFNDRIYFVADVKTGETITNSYETGGYDADGKAIMDEYSYDETRTGIFSMALDGSDVQGLDEYKPENIVGTGSYADSLYTNVNQLAVGTDGNIWILENVYGVTYNLPEDFVSSETSSAWDYAEQSEEYCLVELDGKGVELSRIDLASVAGAEDYFYVNSMTIDKDGNFYMIANSKLYAMDSEGQMLFENGMEDGWVDSLFTLGDKVFACMYGQASGKQELKTIDLASKGFGTESYPVPYGAYNFIPGGGEYDYYHDNGTSLFGCDLETGEAEKIITWINSDVDGSNISSVIPLEDGRIVALSQNYSSGESVAELITMNLTPTSEVAHKETITYACMWLDYNLRSAIIKFNRTNANYRIEVQDYSEYNTEEDYSAGQTKLTAEILSGKVPDIFSTNGLPINRYGAKELLEDLWPFIEGDTELGGRDALVGPIFDALTTEEGKLYQIVPSASLWTVFGSSSVVGDKPGWTVEDAIAALATMPEGCEMFDLGITQTDILAQICNMGIDSFVDWETGACGFDSDEFIQLLEFAKIFPESFDWDSYYAGEGAIIYNDDFTRIKEGKQMLASGQLYSLDYYQLYKQAFNGNMTAVGFPGSSSASAFSLENGLAMSSSCKNKDGAWEFMRMLLDEKYQQENYSYSGLPSNQKAFDNMFKEAMTPEYVTDSTGKQVERPKATWGFGGGENVEFYAMTQEECDELMELINSTTRIYAYDKDLYDVIADECTAFFAGQRSAQETAKNVQSRVSLYVNEQR